MKKIAFPFIPTLFMLFISCTSKNTDIPVCDNSGIIWGSTFEYTGYYYNNLEHTKKICADNIQIDSVSLKGYGTNTYQPNFYCYSTESKTDYTYSDGFLYEIDFATGSERYIPLNFYKNFQYLKLIRVNNSECYFLGISKYDKRCIIKFNIKTGITSFSKYFDIESYYYFYGASDRYLYYDTAYYDLNTLEKKQYPFEMKFVVGVLNPEEDRIAFMKLSEENEICILDMNSNKIIRTGIKRKFDIANRVFIPEALFFPKRNILYYSTNIEPWWLNLKHLLTMCLFPSYEFTEWYAYNLETKETVKLNCPDKHGYIIGFTK